MTKEELKYVLNEAKKACEEKQELEIRLNEIDEENWDMDNYMPGYRNGISEGELKGEIKVYSWLLSHIDDWWKE